MILLDGRQAPSCLRQLPGRITGERIIPSACRTIPGTVPLLSGGSDGRRSGKKCPNARVGQVAPGEWYPLSNSLMTLSGVSLFPRVTNCFRERVSKLIALKEAGD